MQNMKYHATSIDVELSKSNFNWRREVKTWVKLTELWREWVAMNENTEASKDSSILWRSILCSGVSLNYSSFLTVCVLFLTSKDVISSIINLGILQIRKTGENEREREKSMKGEEDELKRDWTIQCHKRGVKLNSTPLNLRWIEIDLNGNKCMHALIGDDLEYLNLPRCEMKCKISRELICETSIQWFVISTKCDERSTALMGLVHQRGWKM